MIPIDGLYKSVTNYLVLKGKGGYGTNAQFNDDVRRAQSLLQNYYIKVYSETNIIEESLSPFIVETKINIIDSKTEKPSDFKHKIAASYEYYVNNSDFADTLTYAFPIAELRADEWASTLNSVIRGANIDKKRGYYGIMDNAFRVSFPNGSLKLTYIKTPPTAIRNITLDSATDNENYNSVGSIDLVWNAADDENNLIDILLWFKGLQIRETEVLSWVIQNKQMNK